MRICPLFLLVILPLAAHNGPPFPIIVDRAVGPVVLSLWTDPDVGVGTFFVIANAPPGGTIPDDLKFEIAVRPATGRLAEARYPMQRQPQRSTVQYGASVSFDAQELWNVRLSVESAKGRGETSASVEVTPPGLGRWDLLLYSSPFLAIGFLWFRVLWQRRKFRRPTAP